MVPEKYRTNRTYIKRAQTLVKNCINLNMKYQRTKLTQQIFSSSLDIKKINSKPNLEKLIKS